MYDDRNRPFAVISFLISLSSFSISSMIPASAEPFFPMMFPSCSKDRFSSVIGA